MANTSVKTKKNFREDAHLNFMSGPSYGLGDPIMRLRIAASTSFFGEPQYYHRDPEDLRKKSPSRAGRSSRNLDAKAVAHIREQLGAMDPKEWRGLTPTELMESAIDAALDHDPEATLQEAVRLRNESFIRVTPQVILVRAAHHEKVRHTGLITKYGPHIIKRADEPTTGLAYQNYRFGRRSIPNSLKRLWKKVLESFDEYQISKYRQESHVVKMVDVVNVVHAKSPAIDKLMVGKAKTTGKTWEAKVSAGKSSKKSWEDSIPNMGHMALLRNLRNFKQKGVDPKLFTERLISTTKNGKQLPFRYFTAYRELSRAAAPGEILDAVDECMTISLENVPEFDGRVMSLVDNSGSATISISALSSARVYEIGNLTGVITARRATEGYIGIFGDKLDVMAIRKKSSIMDQTQEVNRRGRYVGGGTENGLWLFLEKAIKEREHWDHIFVYSDMQAGRGELFASGSIPSEYQWTYGMHGYGGSDYYDVPKLIKEYRDKVNADVFVYLVQIAGYQDTLVPEFYDRSFILGGWGPGLLGFAKEMQTVYSAGN